MQQVRRLVRFSPHRRLRFSIYHTASVRILRTAALRYSTLPGPGNNSIRLGRTDASRQNSKTRDARSMLYRRTGVMLYEALREFNGNCESYCSLEQLVALLCSAHEGKSATDTYYPKPEGYARRYLYRPPGLLCCGARAWTRKVGGLL